MAGMRRTRYVLVGVSAAASAVIAYYAYQYAAIGSAYAAHILCSGVFVSGRSPQSVLDSDLSADDLVLLRSISTDIDMAGRRVEAHAFGLARRTAVYREGLGCVVGGGHEPTPARVTAGAAGQGDGWNNNEDQSTEFEAKLAGVLDSAFAESETGHPKRTRAVVIVHRGRLIAERYADGISQDTPLIGWSMTKSVVNALTGILVQQGALSLDRPLEIDDWPPGDPRRA